MISKRVYVFGLFLAALASAQTLPSTLTSLPAADTRSFVVVPGVVSTDFEFILDPAIGGQELLDIQYQDPALIFSIVRPDGLEITSANAASLGYEFQTVTPDTFSFFIGPLALSGNHLLIQVPSGQAAGRYIVKVNSTASSAASLVTGVYYSSSNVSVGAAAAVAEARPGDVVNFAAIVLKVGQCRGCPYFP